jgi:hypothetical protein
MHGGPPRAGAAPVGYLGIEVHPRRSAPRRSGSLAAMKVAQPFGPGAGLLQRENLTDSEGLRIHRPRVPIAAPIR